MLKRHSVQKLHGDERTSVALGDFVAGDFMDRTNVGVVQRRSGARRFASKTFEGSRIARDIIGQKFQRDKSAERRILGFVTTPIPPPPSFSTMR